MTRRIEGGLRERLWPKTIRQGSAWISSKSRLRDVGLQLRSRICFFHWEALFLFSFVLGHCIFLSLSLPETELQSVVLSQQGKTD